MGDGLSEEKIQSFSQVVADMHSWSANRMHSLRKLTAELFRPRKYSIYYDRLIELNPFWFAHQLPPNLNRQVLSITLQVTKHKKAMFSTSATWNWKVAASTNKYTAASPNINHCTFTSHIHKHWPVNNAQGITTHHSIARYNQNACGFNYFSSSCSL